MRKQDSRKGGTQTFSAADRKNGGWGLEHCQLYLFLSHLSFRVLSRKFFLFRRKTVEDMGQDYIANVLDSPEHFVETTDKQAADGELQKGNGGSLKTPC